MAYITEGDLENFILEDIDSSFSSWITSVIDAVEAYIDNYCGTDFANTASSDNFYDGSGSDELFIGNVQSISSVVFLDIYGNTYATLSASDYYLYPLNSPTQSILKLRGINWSAFPMQARSVKVTGVFGQSTAPLPVKMAGIQLAAKLINDGLRGGEVSSENLGSYSVSYQKVDEVTESMRVKEILDQYRIMSLD